jgi:hypothetical protein
MGIRAVLAAGCQLGSEFDRHHDFEDDTGAGIDAVADEFMATAVRYGCWG